MKGRFYKTVEILRGIAGKYTGKEAGFNDSIAKLCRIESNLIRCEIKAACGFYPCDVQRVAVLQLLPELEKIGTMENLRRFLDRSEILLFNI